MNLKELCIETGRDYWEVYGAIKKLNIKPAKAWNQSKAPIVLNEEQVIKVKAVLAEKVGK